MSARTKYSTVVAAVLVLPILVGCSDIGSVTESAAGGTSATVVVASGPTPESAVLAEVYSTVLASSGVPSRVEAQGDRTEFLAALDAARVTLVPEFTGSLLAYYDPANTARSADDVFEALSRSLPEGLSVSDYASAEDRAVVALERGSAASTGVRTLSAFAPACAATVAVLSPRFVEERALEQLATGVDCTFADVEVSDAAQATSTTAFGTTTLSALAQSDTVTVLADADHVLAAQNVVPLFRTGALGDDAIKALSVVAGELSTTDLALMIEQVRSGQASATAVARTWWDTRQ